MTDLADETKTSAEKKNGFFSRLKMGLAKTRDTLAGGIDNILRGKAKVGPELLDELEEVMLSADVGASTTGGILDELKKGVGQNRIRTREEVIEHLKESLVRILDEPRKELKMPAQPPLVLLVIGVNGSGKTTTIGKLAQKWKAQGKRVMLGAGDTFRAAAIEQLRTWADRIGIPCIQQKSGADPSAVAYDAVQAGRARDMDIVIIDTAGRLQTNSNLMEELKKVKRVIGKALPGAPHETLLVLDASIGQNSVSQARLFHEALAIDGLVMTKLDGTSKGGILFHITRELKLPVLFIGIGEKVEDLQEFDSREFVRALFEK
ncbi:MAG: signal recognition particle-docking protein FtsY [Nitrospinae bacterium]|nr:signal recognition particle-docking protein FtsY [Nitrospinota bacterium]